LSTFDSIQEIRINASLAEGETAIFTFTDPSGLQSEGLVIRYQGKLRAFKNVCRHQPLPLDYGDGDFLDDSGRYLLCRNHAALFEPDSGLCISGPCTGASLFQYPVEEHDGQIVVTIPYEEIELE
jgi:nitrite reductase/ring-hydroxylating ferredoxin subunit